MKKPLIILLAVVLAFTAFVTIESIWIQNRQDYMAYNTEPDDTVYDALSFVDVSDYYAYLATHEDAPLGTSSYTLGNAQIEATDGDVVVWDDYEGVDDVLYTGEDSSVTWRLDAAEEGFYHIRVVYYPVAGKSSSIERSLLLNDEVPFEGADNIVLHRIWANDGEIRQDLIGNDIRPSQVETPFWTDALIQDHVGYVSEPYRFYLQEGSNTLTFDSVREPLVIGAVELIPIETLPSYDSVAASYEQQGLTEVTDRTITFQAEEQSYSTSPTLYPLNDRTSPKTVPSDPRLVRLNTIGGNNWRVAGDRITWTFEVPETGLYRISMRVKQKLAVGMNVHRNIYLDDAIPFAELRDYAFEHSGDWRIQTLGTPDEPYLFHLEAGEHTLTMEVSLGSYGPLIAQVQSSINELNRLYREILVYTGPEPDQYRDYQLTERIDNLIGRLTTEKENLEEIQARIIEIADATSEKTGILDTVILQLEDFIEKPREIHRNLLAYNSNISSLGTLVLLLSAQPLELDYFLVHGADADFPANRAGTLERWWFGLRSFLATFVTDYSALGQADDFDTTETVEVWLSIGRDQANVLRKLIDESFTPNTGIKIDLKLVNGAVLLPATLSNVGPDVAMGLGNSIPVNYAMRSAVYDISQFDDFEEVTERFQASAMVPFAYEGGYYALPEQQIFLMMFYRTDIFEELGLTVPDTWDDVIRLIPDLQKHNLEFYLPVPITQGAVMNLPPNPVFATMFYQNDGEFYINGNTESGFNEGKGPEVFERWTQFYTDYSFPVQADFVNRFRSGQMPIGINYYNVYNVLSVFAPEIRGKWDFVHVPGTVYEDAFGQEAIRRETVSTGTAVMIMQDAKNKDAAWEYLKWWTSTATQVQFGREMEGILGAAARYPTANVEALAQLPWTVEEFRKLEAQWEWVRGIPEVPGGYMTGRHLDNAFRLVYNETTNPRETIYDYVQVINDEIAKKRREFGLSN